MGASSFTVVGRGETAREAFKALVAATRENNRINGDPDGGTIAMKSDFRMRTLPEGIDPADRRACFDHADDLTMIEDGPTALTKYGPAACIPLLQGEWMFLGWAAE